MTEKKIMLKSFTFKYAERLSYQGITFLINIVLARILGPEAYGVLALLMVFIVFSQVFVQSGLNYSLVQAKNVNEDSYNSVLLLSMIMVTVIYVILFVFSPTIADFYNLPSMSMYLRILGLILFPIAYSSIQNAIIMRKMQFKLLLFSSLVSVVLSGVLGILLAINGFGVWALIAQQLSTYILSTFVLSFYIKWKPKLNVSLANSFELIKYGWKLLVGGLFITLYQESTSLIIGKFYSPKTVGFYNRGIQFPRLIAINLNSSVQTVLFPIMSKKQDDNKILEDILNKSVLYVSFFMIPLLLGMASISEPMVQILLGSEWIPAVPFIKIMSIFYIFQTLTTTNTQAIMAVGRSDIVMILLIIKSVIGVAITVALAILGVDLIFIIWLMVLLQIIHYIISTLISSKNLLFSYIKQFLFVVKNLTSGAIMYVILIYIPGNLIVNPYILIIATVLIGAFIYITTSYVLRNEALKYLFKFFRRKESLN
jgi:O-antigen/teichoic acid export membrane protein